MYRMYCHPVSVEIQTFVNHYETMNVAIFSILLIADKGAAVAQSPVRVFVELLMTETNEDNTVGQFLVYLILIQNVRFL